MQPLGWAAGSRVAVVQSMKMVYDVYVRNTESELMRAIQLRASELGHRLWRNNIGLCKNPMLRYGLCVGSADLIGLSNTGRFLAVECKSANGRLTKEQESFLATVRRLNGIGIVAKSVEDFKV
jgi:VRR-NUC domain